MKNNIIKITRQYKFTQAEIKKKLGLIGDLHQAGLWEGRSPNDIKNGVEADSDIYYIETEEKTKEADG